MDAFVPSYLPRTSTSCKPPTLRNLIQKCPPTLIKSPHVARRRRFHACAGETPDPKSENSETPEGESGSPSDDLDTTESDLVLPNLRELFAGAGKPGCEQCGGKGEILCPVCDAKGFVALTMMDTTSSTQCRMCRGQRIVPCPTCRQIVYKSVVWWDQIPSKEDDPDEKWREGPDGEPRFPWTPPPTES